ncbi:MAG TPA: hypothetical protein PLW35_02690, partial [Verrucomicrobiota bacterium]|nr:hypothetical protein [Verrucomicrobiota bacterium]
WAEKQSGSKLPHSKRFAPTNALCIRGRAWETIGISALFLATSSLGKVHRSSPTPGAVLPE